jgi:fimbrial chaperone protein
LRAATRPFFRASIAALIFATTAAQAGVFSVTPVRIFMAPRDRATAVTITNDGDDELVMQADVYRWNQKPSGEDDLTLSEDLILSPPILKLAPHSRQVVRLAMVTPPAADAQLTYRMIVREVPEATKNPKDVQLQVALAFSLPVFITPPGLKRELACTGKRSAATAVTITCANRGRTYAQPREVALSTADGKRVASKDFGLYLLPGIQRTYEVQSSDGPIPTGPLKLALTFDDGSVESFDLNVAD